MELLSILTTIVKAFFILYCVAALGASVVGAKQEAKIWAPANLPSLSTFGMVKVFFFNVLWIASCTIGCVIIWIKHILTLGTSDVAHDCNAGVERYGAFLCCQMVGRVRLVGAENLPPDDGSVPAPVYIANHASQVDLGAVYYIRRRFKWIAKQSVLYVPGAGATMYTGDHVLINRSKGKNKKSVGNLFDKSNAAVQSGVPMFLFPQGTRVMSKRLPFKDGAFIIAQANKSTLVPISLEIPMNAWETWYPLSRAVVPEAVVTVHKPIPVTGEEDREELKNRCSDIIYSVLPKIYEEEEAGEDKKKDDGVKEGDAKKEEEEVKKDK